MTLRIERLKACLNGSRSRQEHPAVPVTPDELAEAGDAATTAGAEALHVHPRDDDGTQTLLAEPIAAAVSAIRRRCPSTPVGVSTGLWISGGDARVRLEAVSGWAELPIYTRPDFASVNLSEPGFQELATELNAAGIAVEAGVWSVSDADAAADWAPPSGWLRILVEILDPPSPDVGTADRPDEVAAAARATADAILRRLDDRAVAAPRLLHGEGPACWPLVTHAGRLGLPTRIGLEDTLVGPQSEPVGTNSDLVTLAVRLLATATPPPSPSI